MTLLIPPSIADRLPSMVRNELAAMDARRQEEFVEEYRRKAKSSPPATCCGSSSGCITPTTGSGACWFCTS